MKVTSLVLLAAPAFSNPLSSLFMDKRQAPPPNQISIVSARTSGSGCPQGSVVSTFSPDRTVVTFGFDKFQTYIGPNTNQGDRSKNCQIHLQLQYPGGFSYSVMQATYHGYARLDPGVTGTFLSTYFFSQNASNTATTRTTISGPEWVNGNIYTKVDNVENAAIVWSPCGATGILNANNRIALTANNNRAAGELSDDDATVAFTQQVNIQWRRC